MRRSRTRKSTIGADPFAAVIPAAIEESVERRLEKGPKPKRPRPVKPVQPVANMDRPAPELVASSLTGRQKLTVHLEAELVNRVKNAAYWNPRLTIARIAEQGIRIALEKVEKENGGPYPQREGDLIGGRPIK